MREPFDGAPCASCGGAQVRGITPPDQRLLHRALRLLIGSVWVFHGLYSKILNGIPRHEMIVARVFGADLARPATVVIGCGEILLGVWAFTHRFPRSCAAVQTSAIVAMNALEISRAPDLLISAPGMLALNACFLVLAWFSAVRVAQGSQPSGLHRAAGTEERGQSCP